jgi:CRISPR/Cas system-associated protein Cas10 (large subunit of type III CRISPR-Cas system)/DNA-binding transcriptional MerR regulator
MDEWQSWLVSFDTDRIKQYLFATNRLKEIRGGSALLLDLDDQREALIKQAVSDAEVVYSGGGGAAALVHTEEQAKQLIAHITHQFHTATITASITGISLSPELANERKFGERTNQAGKRLRQAKAAKAETTTLPVEPYLRLCQSCGQHPVVTPPAGQSEEWLCASCARKREKGDRSVLYDKFRECVEASIGKDHPWVGETLPRDLDWIGEVSFPPNYVGFIALDGNNIGNLLCEPATVEKYHRFSEGLHHLTGNQTFSALQRYGRPRNGVTPFEIILIGGDDVLLITAADIAIEVALAIAERFQANSQRDVLEKANIAGDKLTMAGGVVLAHADFPIPAMHSLAEALQRSAKKLCAIQGYKTGAIDFLVVSGSDTDLEEMRRAIPHRRPYTLRDMQTLLDYIRCFKSNNFPMSQLQNMYQALFEGEVNAQMASIATLGYLGQREGKRKLYDLLRSFFKKFGVKFDGQLPPWDAEIGERDGHRVSALTDLAELYPFIQGERGA